MRYDDTVTGPVEPGGAKGGGAVSAEAHEIALQALRIIAGKQQCIDNLMSHAEIAAEALRLIENLECPARLPSDPAELPQPPSGRGDGQDHSEGCAAPGDPKTKALFALDAMVQKGIRAELDQIEVTSGLTALAAARFMAANGIHDRGRRRVMVRNIVGAFEKRLKHHLAKVGDPGANG